MTQQEYNDWIKVIQGLPLETRILTDYDIDARGNPRTGVPQPWRARFEAYYGRWRWLGTQYRPFQADAAYEWYELEAMRLCGELGRDLSH